MELAGLFRCPFRTRFLFYDPPDTMCLANIRLSRWDEAIHHLREPIHVLDKSIQLRPESIRVRDEFI
jgi:hypothetical protein